MLSKESETYAVVIHCTTVGRGYYEIKVSDAEGGIYEFMLHEETMVDYRLIVGKEIDKETFEDLQTCGDYQQAYSYAIGILARRMYTEKEIRRKLYERETADGIVCDVVAKLLEVGVLNDGTYARVYIENQVALGKKSRRQILADLHAKGVSTNIIDEMLDLFNEADEFALIDREIEKLYQRYSRKDLSDFELKNKIVQALGRKGFQIDDVKRQYEFFIEDLAGLLD